MNNKIFSIIALFAFFLMGNGYTVNAQKWHINSYDTSSIVRKVNNTTRLVYSHGKQGQFFMITPTSTVAQVLSFYEDSNVYVKDFEIFNDSVFFCGTRKINNVYYAVFGYFPLADFPVCTTRLDTLSALKSFNRMVVYSIGGVTRVSLTASYHSGYGTMVDIRKLGPDAWEYNVAVCSTIYHLFDDVAETTNNVVFTSRFSPGKYYNTRIWVLNKPAYGSGSLFVSTVNRLKLAKPTIGPVLCPKLYAGDMYLTALKTLNDTIIVSKYGGSGYSTSVYFKGIPPFTLKDLKTHTPMTFCDLLATTQTSTFVDSYIYHVREDLFNVGSAMYALKYANEEINSIDRLSNMTGSFIASGHDNNYSLRIYGYVDNSWICAERKSYGATPKEYTHTPEQLGMTVSNYEDTIPVHATDTSVCEMGIICPLK